MQELLETLEQHIRTIESRKPMEKKLSRAKIINRKDGTSDIRTYYQTIIIQNKPRKSDYVKLRKIVTRIVKSSDNIDILNIAKYIIEFKKHLNI